MLHAFLRKGVRRVLVVGKREPLRDGNEDAVTSIVFGPLCFMATPEAVRCLGAAFGTPFANFLAGREPSAHEVLFWPSGMRAEDDDGIAVRCEPDLVVDLQFADGSRAAVICEMKWDSRDGADELAGQIDREREAVLGKLGIARTQQFTVALTKNRLSYVPEGVGLALTWSALEWALSVEARTGRAGTPSRLWSSLTAQFLREANQSSFQGFGDVPDLTALASAPFVFLGETA